MQSFTEELCFPPLLLKSLLFWTVLNAKVIYSLFFGRSKITPPDLQTVFIALNLFK